MSTKTSEEQTGSRAKKRARFAGKSDKAGGPSPLILVAGIFVALALIGGMVFFLVGSGPDQTPVSSSVPAAELGSYPIGSQGLLVSAATHGHDPYPLVQAEQGQVRLALATFDDYKAHYYTYMHEGKPIEFFVLKSKDGTVRAAFNACDVCYLSKKGYTQDGDYVICNNCGRRFPANEINVVHGGCNPSGLERTVEGDTLVIQVKDIIGGAGYF
jgi:hypothetical protein